MPIFLDKIEFKIGDSQGQKRAPTEQEKIAVDRLEGLMASVNNAFDAGLLANDEAQKFEKLILQKEVELATLIGKGRLKDGEAFLKSEEAQLFMKQINMCTQLFENANILMLPLDHDPLLNLKKMREEALFKLENYPGESTAQEAARALREMKIEEVMKEFQPATRNLVKGAHDFASAILSNPKHEGNYQSAKLLSGVMQKTSLVAGKLDRLKLEDLIPLVETTKKINQEMESGVQTNVTVTLKANWSKVARNINIIAGIALIATGIAQICAAPVTFGASALSGWLTLSAGFMMLGSAGLLHLGRDKDRVDNIKEKEVYSHQREIALKSDALNTALDKVLENAHQREELQQKESRRQETERQQTSSRADGQVKAPEEAKFRTAEGKPISLPPLPPRPTAKHEDGTYSPPPSRRKG